MPPILGGDTTLSTLFWIENSPSKLTRILGRSEVVEKKVIAGMWVEGGDV